jgi:hypothetical protein
VIPICRSQIYHLFFRHFQKQNLHSAFWRRSAQRGPIRVILSTTHRQDVMISCGLYRLNVGLSLPASEARVYYVDVWHGLLSGLLRGAHAPHTSHNGAHTTTKIRDRTRDSATSVHRCRGSLTWETPGTHSPIGCPVSQHAGARRSATAVAHTPSTIVSAGLRREGSTTTAGTAARDSSFDGGSRLDQKSCYQNRFLPDGCPPVL